MLCPVRPVATVQVRTFHTQGDGVRNTLTVADDGASMSVVWDQQTDDKDWFRWMEIGFDLRA